MARQSKKEMKSEGQQAALKYEEKRTELEPSSVPLLNGKKYLSTSGFKEWQFLTLCIY